MNRKQRRLIILTVVLGLLLAAMIFRQPAESSKLVESSGKEALVEERLDVISLAERTIFENRVKVLAEFLNLDEEQEWELRFYFEGITSDIADGAALAQKDLKEALYGAGLRPTLERVMTDQQRAKLEQNAKILGFSSERGRK